MNSVATLNVHGIGVPPRMLEPGEDGVWISVRQFEQVLDTIAGRQDVRLTFDDGNLSDVQIALPMLIERRLEAEFFICAGLFGQPGRLTIDHVRDLLEAGMSVGSHGWSHVDWRRCDTGRVLQEVQASRNVLQDITGSEVRHVSVPFGSYDRHVLAELRHFGVSRVYTSDGGRTRPDAWLQPRTSLRHDLDQAWIDRVIDPQQPLQRRVRNMAALGVKRSRGTLRPSRRKATVDPTEASPRATPALPRLGIVIVTFNSAEALQGCLNSLNKGCAGIDLRDVVVVDNASSDESARVAAGFDDAPVRAIERDANVGYAAAINTGVGAMDLKNLDAVLVLNPDCRLRSGSLGPLVDALATPGRGIVVPKLVNPDGSLQPSLRHAPAISRSLAESALGRFAGKFGLGELVMMPGEYDHDGVWAWATGAAMLLSPRMIAEIGPWDESFLLYSEETEYALRAADYGWHLWYEPDSVIEHVGGVGHLRADLAALLASNRVRLYRLRHGIASAGAFYLVELAGAAARAAAGRSQARAAVAALMRPSRRIRKLPAAA